ncbi:MAG: hypothetical protein MJ211_16375 [Bacteroidales bacterium]|nr:hypothetical protein [Bacteroidales bacterium]
MSLGLNIGGIIQISSLNNQLYRVIGMTFFQYENLNHKYFYIEYKLECNNQIIFLEDENNECLNSQNFFNIFSDNKNYFESDYNFSKSTTDKIQINIVKEIYGESDFSINKQIKYKYTFSNNADNNFLLNIRNKDYYGFIVNKKDIEIIKNGDLSFNINPKKEEISVIKYSTSNINQYNFDNIKQYEPNGIIYKNNNYKITTQYVTSTNNIELDLASTTSGNIFYLKNYDNKYYLLSINKNKNNISPLFSTYRSGKKTRNFLDGDFINYTDNYIDYKYIIVDYNIYLEETTNSGTKQYQGIEIKLNKLKTCTLLPQNEYNNIKPSKTSQNKSNNKKHQTSRNTFASILTKILLFGCILIIFIISFATTFILLTMFDASYSMCYIISIIVGVVLSWYFKSKFID